MSEKDWQVKSHNSHPIELIPPQWPETLKFIQYGQIITPYKNALHADLHKISISGSNAVVYNSSMIDILTRGHFFSE